MFRFSPISGLIWCRSFCCCLFSLRSSQLSHFVCALFGLCSLCSVVCLCIASLFSLVSLCCATLSYCLVCLYCVCGCFRPLCNAPFCCIAVQGVYRLLFVCHSFCVLHLPTCPRSTLCFVSVSLLYDIVPISCARASIRCGRSFFYMCSLFSCIIARFLIGSRVCAICGHYSIIRFSKRY